MSALAHPTESAIETLRLTAGAVTDPAGRDENQDIGIALQLVAPADDGLPGEGFLLIVADGMGGHPFGDVASRIATDALMTVFTTIPEGDLGQALKQAYRQANEAIAREVEREPAQAGMGTTLTTALLRGCLDPDGPPEDVPAATAAGGTPVLTPVGQV